MFHEWNENQIIIVNQPSSSVITLSSAKLVLLESFSLGFIHELIEASTRLRRPNKFVPLLREAGSKKKNDCPGRFFL